MARHFATQGHALAYSMNFTLSIMVWSLVINYYCKQTSYAYADITKSHYNTVVSLKWLHRLKSSHLEPMPN